MGAVILNNMIFYCGIILFVKCGESQYRGISEEHITGKNIELMINVRDFEATMGVEGILGWLISGQGGIQQGQFEIGFEGCYSTSDSVFQ
jgi:hypothetical protein